MRAALAKFYKEIDGMALSDGDKAMCMEIAREIIKEALKEHIDTCPVNQTILRTKLFLIGICIGSGFASGGLVLGIAKLVFRV